MSELEEDMKNDRLLSGQDARKFLGNISKTTVWRYINQGLLHPPIKPNPRQNYFKYSWLLECVEKMEAMTKDNQVISGMCD